MSNAISSNFECLAPETHYAFGSETISISKIGPQTYQYLQISDLFNYIFAVVNFGVGDDK